MLADRWLSEALDCIQFLIKSESYVFLHQCLALLENVLLAIEILTRQPANEYTTYVCVISLPTEDKLGLREN